MEEEQYYEHLEIEPPIGAEMPHDACAKINSEITEGILTQGLPLEDDHERRNQEHLELFETLDCLLIYICSKEQIAETIEVDSPEKSAIVEIYIQEVIQKAFVLIAGYIQIKKDITLALQFCWQKITSKENRLFVLEKMRALIKKEQDEDVKKKLFQALVSSIENSLDNPENSVGVLFEDENYAEIHEDLVKLTSDSDDKKGLVASFMLDMIKANFLTETDLWEKISLHANFTSYLDNVCNKFENQFKDVDPAITKAWEKILFPRLLIWGNLIYSDSLLLPKKQTEN